MPEIRCRIVRWVADEPQPGLVQAELTDASGRIFRFIDKAAIFSSDGLLPTSPYPVTGAIRCEIVCRSGGILIIDTGRPDGVESGGQSRFRVEASEVAGD